MKKILVSTLLLVFLVCLSSCNVDNQEETRSDYFLVQYDYGNITKDEVTILIDGCLPFFEFEDYGIDNVYPGDQLYIEYTGKPVMALSYPGQMFGIEVKSVKLHDRIVKEVSEDEIERDNNGYITNILSNENMLKYIILDEELNYVPLNEYQGTTIYSLHYNDNEIGSTEDTIDTPVCCYLAFDPTDTLLTTKTIFGFYQSTKEEYNSFFNKYNMYNKDYYVVDNYEAYIEVWNDLPKGIAVDFDFPLDNNESKKENEVITSEFFENNIIILHRRNISGSGSNIPVKYYYDKKDNIVKKKYVNDIYGVDETLNFLGYAIDVIEMPKDIYQELNK